MLRLLAGLLLSSLSSTPAAQDQPLRVTIRAGEKTHGPGQHDHPRFLTDWTLLLEERGCTVQGGLEFPGVETLEQTDVLVLYAAEGGSIAGDERARLEAYLARGGGIVVLHDAVCGDDPHWFKTVVGGAWEHGHSQWHEGEIGLYFTEREHAITRGVANFDFTDEVYWDLHLDPAAQVLAEGFHTPFDVTPQMWVFEKDDYRAFVSLQGHEHASFSHPAWRTLLLRGIAWAGQRHADVLVTADEVAELRYPAGGPRRPDAAAQSLILPDGFRAELVAAEPLVVNPISLDWDPDGRMWVALTPGYPYKTESSGISAHDQIVILDDSDDDGRMDSRTVFAEGLDLVTSLVFHEDGVIVTQAPDIYWLRDTDGDDRADEKVTLFTGFGHADTHAVLSNMRLGLDGWIYATQGYSGGASRNIIGLDGTDHGHIGNGVLRFKPDGSAIEMVVSYGSNTWGLDFSWDGELFYTMANGSHLRHVVLPDKALATGRLGDVPSWIDVTDHTQARPLSRHQRAPYLQIDFVGGFTAAAGSCIYEGGAWPIEYQGDHFVCEPTINLVHRDVVRSKGRAGPTFEATKPRTEEFLASRDPWFRPVHLRVGPDGALYVLDFYNQAAVHNDTRGPEHGPTNAAVRPDRDHLHGRIWRIQHLRAGRGLRPSLGEAARVALARELEHPNRWRRMTAHRLLMERGLDAESRRVLADMVVGETVPHAKIHALWILGRSGVERDKVAALRNDYYAEVRKNVWVLDRELDVLGMSWRRITPGQFQAEDPRTRLTALLAWRDHFAAKAPELLELYTWLEDDWSRSMVLGIAAKQPVRFLESMLGVDDERPYVELATALVTHIARSGDQAGAVRVVGSLSKLGARAPRISEQALRALSQELPDSFTPWPSPNLERHLRKLLASKDARVAIAALPLARRWAGDQLATSEYRAVADRLRAIAEDPDQELELRLACLQSLLALPEDRVNAVATAGRFLDPYFPLEIQLRVIALLGEDNDAEVARLLTASFSSLSHPAREQAFNLMVQRPQCVAPLLDAVAAGDLRAADLGPHRVHRLKQHPSEAIAVRAQALLGAIENRDTDALIARLLPVVSTPGDALRGRELFEANCANCHAFAGEGAHVGPDLTGMGAHGAASLLPFILDPNRSVEAGYLEYVAETVDGRLLDGVIVRETADAILLRNSSGEVEVRRDGIESLYSTGRSPMPTGFEELGAEGLRDILTYLAGEYGDFRILDLETVATASTDAGMYDRARDDKPLRFERHGVVDVDGVPFELLDPLRLDSNVLVLKGGLQADWESKLHMPQEVEIPLGFALKRLHVLGGIAAWGYPFTQSRDPACKLTWHYADGTVEEQVFVDGKEFADWIRRHDVPESEWVDLLAEGSQGQVRRFSVAPSRPAAVVEKLTLASFDNHLAPTFVALTAEIAGDSAMEATAAEVEPEPADIVLFGGGSSHDFQRWFAGEDLATLGVLTDRSTTYSEDPGRLAELIAGAKVVILCNNQPLTDPQSRTALFEHVASGGGLVLVHAALWFNWADWPQYNAQLAGGGARSHENLGPFGVVVEAAAHAVLAGVPASFTITDELYRFEQDPAAELEVLAVGHSLTTGAAFPVVWTHSHGAGRIVSITLGHDGGSHAHPAYRMMLRNAVRWVEGG